MKTKQYLFNIEEVIAIREALIEYRQILRQGKINNEHKKQVDALADQFKQDAILWRS